MNRMEEIAAWIAEARNRWGPEHKQQVLFTALAELEEIIRRPENTILAASSKMLMDSWNTMAIEHDLPIVRGMNRSRTRQLAARLRESEDWMHDALMAIGEIPENPFLLGENDRGWRANIDFLLRPGTVDKILEGAYLDGPGPQEREMVLYERVSVRDAKVRLSAIEEELGKVKHRIEWGKGDKETLELRERLLAEKEKLNNLLIYGKEKV